MQTPYPSKQAMFLLHGILIS